MNLRISKHMKVVVAVALVASAALLSSSALLASNMGFKMNRVISPVAVPAPKGTNLVALPFKSPYINAQDVCAALGLTTGTGKVVQVNAASGSTLSHTCGAANPFVLLQYVGLKITNPTTAGGILVGSHQANASITLQPVALPAPKGDNNFPTPYHTTSVNAQDVCTDLGLPANAKVIRIDAAAGATLSYTCNTANPFSLVLGEGLKISYTGAPIVIAPGHPAHF